MSKAILICALLVTQVASAASGGKPPDPLRKLPKSTLALTPEALLKEAVVAVAASVKEIEAVYQQTSVGSRLRVDCVISQLNSARGVLRKLREIQKSPPGGIDGMPQSSFVEINSLSEKAARASTDARMCKGSTDLDQMIANSIPGKVPLTPTGGADTSTVGDSTPTERPPLASPF